MSFAAAMAGLFASPLMSVAATYSPVGGGASVPLRIILRAPDAVSEFSGARFVSATARLDCLVADVPTLREGDQFVTGASERLGDPEAAERTSAGEQDLRHQPAKSG